MEHYLLLFGGLIALLISGDLLVRGGVSLARHFRVSTLVVGMTVVSLGTSAPELVVALKSALSGHADVATGTVVGSNISNIGLVLGLTALILPLSVNPRTILFDWPFMMLATLLFFFFILNGSLQRIEGVLFLLLLSFFVVYSIYDSRKKQRKLSSKIEKPKYSIWLSVLIIVISACGLRYGAEWLVNGASGLARSFGISEYIISVTIIAFGTSVPELATSVIAAIKKESDISIGNIIGSNLFNIWGILGVTAIVTKIPINQQIVDFDIYMLFGISIFLLIAMLPARNGKISRLEGAILVVFYATYVILIFNR